jgi:hypothetical protein
MRIQHVTPMLTLKILKLVVHYNIQDFIESMWS